MTEEKAKINLGTRNLLDYDELMAELRPRMREWKTSWQLIRSNWSVMVGVVMVLFMVFLAIFAPILAPPKGNDAMTIPKDFMDPKPPFIQGHPLGTGQMGADIYYGVIWGARTSILTAIFVVFTAAFIGLMLGALSGYYGGKIDEFIMRFTDVFLSLPALILAMAIAAILSRNIENMMFALVIVWWPGYARLVRAQVLSVRENTYVEAAKAVGARRNRVLFRHIVPNSLSPLVVSITLDMGAVSLVAAGLSFIGFGVQSGTAEWGRMVSDGYQWFGSTIIYQGQEMTPWWVITFPGLAILVFTMGFSLMGDGFRDILDPRSRR